MTRLTLYISRWAGGVVDMSGSKVLKPVLGAWEQVASLGRSLLKTLNSCDVVLSLRSRHVSPASC
jgi:hypothetical protein